MRMLLTGSTGFVGSYLCKSFPNSTSLDANGYVDIRNRDKVFQIISTVRPDRVIHLAAQSFVPDSFNNPSKTFEINFMGTLNLLQALKSVDFSGRFLYIGSSDVYGMVNSDKLPVTESFPLLPRNPYAVSKVAAEALCYQWSQTENFEIILARPFNHIGPGQNPQFVVADFTKQVVEIATGRRKPRIEVGDIEITRDFTDVKDVVEAYKVLLEYGKNGEVYNVCSGKERLIRSILEKLLELMDVEAEIVVVPERFRRSEQRRMCGSFHKIHSELGWIAQIPFETTLREVLLDWERKLN